MNEDHLRSYPTTYFLTLDDTINGEEYHEEFDPPPEGTYTGLQNKSKVQSVIDLSNDREQAQVRYVHKRRTDN